MALSVFKTQKPTNLTQQFYILNTLKMQNFASNLFLKIF